EHLLLAPCDHDGSSIGKEKTNLKPAPPLDLARRGRAPQTRPPMEGSATRTCPGRVTGLLAAALLAVLLGSSRSGADDAATKTIELKGDRLTVRVTGVALEEVLQAVVTPSKGELRGSVKQPHDVTTDFEDVPLQDGLARLLGDQNFVLTYREDGTLRALTLLGGPQDESSGAKIVKQSPPAQPSAAELMQRNVPVPPAG